MRVATLFYTAFVLMALVVDGALHRGFEDRRFKGMLDELTNHFTTEELRQLDALARPAAPTGVRA